MISTIKFVPRSVNFTTALNYSIIKQSRLLNKLMNKEVKYRTKLNKKTTKLAQEFFPNPNEQFDRRLGAINKVYMQNLSEILQGQKYNDHLVDLGVEITKVKIHKNHSHISVYWISKNDNLNVEETQNILKKTAGEIQQEISSLRYIGKLPQLRFVRDAYLESQIKVEKLLTVMDLGKDYEPSKPQKAFKSSFAFEADETIPKMKQDVLGLDHDKIKGRILDAIAKFRNIELPEKEFDFEEVDPKNLIPFDKNTFKKFYKRRQILQKKMEKCTQNSEIQYPYADNDDYENDEDNEDYESDKDNYDYENDVDNNDYEENNDFIRYKD